MYARGVTIYVRGVILYVRVVTMYVRGFLRSWPSYSLPMHADRIFKGGKEETMTEIKERILASYSLIPENCKGTKCHCMREKARV